VLTGLLPFSVLIAGALVCTVIDVIGLIGLIDLIDVIGYLTGQVDNH
jgi:hypothetical protein